MQKEKIFKFNVSEVFLMKKKIPRHNIEDAIQTHAAKEHIIRVVVNQSFSEYPTDKDIMAAKGPNNPRVLEALAKQGLVNPDGTPMVAIEIDEFSPIIPNLNGTYTAIFTYSTTSYTVH